MATQAIEFVDCGVGTDGHGVFHHAGLAALNLADLRGLLLNREVAVQDTDSPLARHGDSHPRLGDGIHRGGQEGHAQRDIRRQAARGVNG